VALIWKIIATYPGEQAKRGSRKVYKKECLENPIFKYYREKLDTYFLGILFETGIEFC